MYTSVRFAADQKLLYDAVSGRNEKTMGATLRKILKSLALIVSEIFEKAYRDGGGGGGGGGHRRQH